jgi:hypothetical protein
MASSIPSQDRAVDPFASFNSNIVNQLTRMVTRGTNGLSDYNSLQTADATSMIDATSTSEIDISAGVVFKDDVLITITNSHTVDFNDPDHYLNNVIWNMAGTYYIVLEYTYVKSRPAPEAKIKILRPGDLSGYSYQLPSSLFFLKAVSVILNGVDYEIDSVYDYDPAHTENKREYVSWYVGTETGKPTFVQARDVGRIIYDSNANEFWFGAATDWVQIETATIKQIKGNTGTGAGNWTLSSGEYYHDVDASSISSLDVFTCAFYADNGGIMEMIQPTKIQLRNTPYDTVRIWMTVNTIDVYYNISK